MLSLTSLTSYSNFSDAIRMAAAGCVHPCVLVSPGAVDVSSIWSVMMPTPIST